MAGTVEKKLSELGIVLPTPASPIANYIPFTRVGTLLFVSGQICLDTSGNMDLTGGFVARPSRLHQDVDRFIESPHPLGRGVSGGL